MTTGSTSPLRFISPLVPYRVRKAWSRPSGLVIVSSLGANGAAARSRSRRRESARFAARFAWAPRHSSHGGRSFSGPSGNFMGWPSRCVQSWSLQWRLAGLGRLRRFQRGSAFCAARSITNHTSWNVSVMVVLLSGSLGWNRRARLGPGRNHRSRSWLALLGLVSIPSPSAIILEERPEAFAPTSPPP